MIVAAVVIVMAIATIVEKIHGTTFVSTKIYSTWWFSAIWGILAIASIARIITSGMQKTLTVLTLHISFVVILAGALTTHLTSKKGYWRNSKVIHRAKQQRRYANRHPPFLRKT